MLVLEDIPAQGYPAMNTIALSFPLVRLSTGCGHVAAALLAAARHTRRLAETRRSVARMDEHMLADIGVSRAQMTFEIEHAHRWRLFG